MWPMPSRRSTSSALNLASRYCQQRGCGYGARLFDRAVMRRNQA